MTCEEFQELAAAYALSALDPSEREACDAHLAEPEHRGCAEALDRAREAGALLAMSLPPLATPPSVWAGIERRVGAVPSLRPLAWGGWVLAAAAAAVVLWLGVDRDRQRDAVALMTHAVQSAHDEQARCGAELAASKSDAKLKQQAIDLLQQSGTKLIALEAQGGATQTARLIYNPAGQGFLVGGGMLAPAGKDYELWVIRGDRKLPAGLLKGASEGALVAAIDPTLLAGGSPDAIAVTLEPAGGGSAPRGPIVLVAKM